ncbi:MAG: S8 family serine peptidase [Cryobacterium sp.]|nr:S8 family serine peptidase [Oligoflexia bacterium]
MNKKISTSVLTLLSVFIASSASASAFVDSTVRSAQGPVRVIVVMKDRSVLPRSMRSTSSYFEIRKALSANSKISQKTVLDVIGREIGNTHVKPLWIINAVALTIPSEKLSLLQNHPDVSAIYANREVRIIRDFRSSDRSAMAEPFTYGLQMINIPQLRSEKSTATGKGVVVGILDTGVDANHPDLKGKVVGFHDFVNGKTEPYDDHGHGTHVSGTIAGGNASGTAIGIAPDAKIIMAKVFGSNGSSSTEQLLEAMQWISDPDGDPKTHDEPALVSNSWGGGSPSPTADPADDVFCQAIASWMKLGIFPVFAAGNAGPRSGTVGTPGACPAAFAVGATDSKDVVASFSSRGPTVWKTGTLTKPNISAPGVAILSAAPGGNYQTMSGTSMATPHVAGLLTLIYQAVPNISIDDAARLLSSTSKDLGSKGMDTEYGAGRIDALAAVRGAKALRSRNLR